MQLPTSRSVSRASHSPSRGSSPVVYVHSDAPDQQHTEEKLRAMGVKDLKAVLAARGVDCSKAVEKGDLVNLALGLAK